LGGTDGAQAAFPAGANAQGVVGEGIFDDAREGVIDVIATGPNTLTGSIILSPLPNAGFNVARGAFVNTTAGDAPRTIFADGATDGTVAQATGAFPNMLLSVAIVGNRAFFPSSAASPEPPLRFNANVQSLLSVADTVVDQETADTFNLNRGINFDLPAGLLDAQIRDNTDRMFPSAPVDIDCAGGATPACWVVSQGSDFIVRVDGVGDGETPTINAPTAAGGVDPSPVERIYTIDPQDPLNSGRNPRGIAVDANGTRAYVSCPTTRDVVVMDLANRTVLQRARSSELPSPGSLEETVRRGKIDFFTSRPFWSDRGWGGCWSCHPDGRTDTVTWAFEAGPRQTISLDGTFNKRDPEDHRALNWTPVRDENQDFELNTRGVFGGRGFITVNTDLNGDGLMPDSDPNVRNFGPASSGRAQQQEDITAFIQLGIRSAIAPPAGTPNVTRGRDLFGSAAPAGANCVACHSGGKWTTSRITYDQGDVNPVPGTDTGIVNIPPIDLDGDTTIDPSEERAVAVYLNGFNTTAGAGRICEVPPPLPGVDVGGTQAAERIRILRQLGTFTGTNPIELRANAISPVNTTAPGLTVAAAFGGDGFNAPSLLGVFDSAPYFHHGAAATLEQAFGIGTAPAFLAAAQAHWRSGTGGQANVLDQDQSAVTDLIAFVRTIDERTPPFPAADLAPNAPVFADAAVVCDCQKDPPLGTPALDCRP
jgi:DNA-binding beta-propeller fold protein YncE